MKKTVSVLLTLLMLFALALPCFAAGPANFSMNIVSESDTELVLSLNYDGGSSFQNIDFEVKYNSAKLKPTEAYDGDGMNAFTLFVKKNGGNSIALTNKDENPIKGVMATTSPFKVIQGRDLFIFKFQKLTKTASAEGDVSVKFTNCQLDYNTVQAVVTSPWASKGTAAKVTSAAAGSAGQTQAPDAGGAKPGSTEVKSDIQNAASVTDAAGRNTAAENASENTSAVTVSQEEPGVPEKKDIKKAVWIPALAVCVLFIVIAAVVFINKKKNSVKEK